MGIPEKFEIAIPESDLNDLRDRLKNTRWAVEFGNEQSAYGVRLDEMKNLVNYWVNDFDWRKVESEMNAYDHYRVLIDDIPIHFMRIPGKGPNPMPLILTHGWPWSFWDYRKVIEPLTNPAAFGGHEEDAFELIIPSLPGYAFSNPLTLSGVNYARTAQLWHKLMTDVLGFKKYGAGGGDWGAFVTAHLSHLNPPELAGVHLTFPAMLGFDFYSLTADDFGPDEQDWFQQMAYGQMAGYSHMAVHITDPQTLAFAMSDSPLGQAAWMYERRMAWSDCGGDIYNSFTQEELVTSFSLYWLTNSFGSSVRMYPESFRTPWAPTHDKSPTLQAPTGVAIFPKDLLPLPKKFCEQYSNLVQYTVMPRGGHFAPAEQPELVCNDLQSLFRRLR